MDIFCWRLPLSSPTCWVYGILQCFRWWKVLRRFFCCSCVYIPHFTHGQRCHTFGGRNSFGLREKGLSIHYLLDYFWEERKTSTLINKTMSAYLYGPGNLGYVVKSVMTITLISGSFFASPLLHPNWKHHLGCKYLMSTRSGSSFP